MKWFGLVVDRSVGCPFRGCSGRFLGVVWTVLILGQGNKKNIYNGLKTQLRKYIKDINKGNKKINLTCKEKQDQQKKIRLQSNKSRKKVQKKKRNGEISKKKRRLPW